MSVCIGKPIRPLDFSDDRLADLPDRLAEAEPWTALETALNGVVLRVYDLGRSESPIRIDSTSARTYAQVDPAGKRMPTATLDALLAWVWSGEQPRG